MVQNTAQWNSLILLSLQVGEEEEECKFSSV